MRATPGTLQLGDDAGLEVLGELGRGAQAIVYRARRDDTDYALKVLRRDDERDPAAVRDFRRQAALLACAADPGLPRVHLAGTTGDGSPYVLMDLIDGERLDDLLVRGPLDEARATRLAADLAGALGTAHALNLVHRDVKPENILVTPDGAGRLVDFGLATRLVATAPDPAPSDPATSDQARSDQAAGTMSYSPPEQTGMLSRPVDGRSDLYSLGAVLFECVTGRPPYVAGDVGELLKLHAVAAVPDPRALAPALGATFAEIIRRLLAKDPDDRYQSAAGLLTDLRRLAAAPAATFTLASADGPVTQAEPRLAGRDAELNRLHERWRTAAAGHGGIVVLRGASGSGKTRLATELAGHVERAGGTVLRGAATGGDHRPLAGIRAALDSYLRTGGTAGFRVRAAATPAAGLLQQLSPMMTELLGVPPAVDGASREQYAGAVAGLLTRLAGSGPVLLHLDDVQLADEPATGVLARLAAEIPTVPMLVVLATRDDDGPAGLGPALDTDLTLGPLSEAAIGDLLSAQGGRIRPEAASIAWTTALSGGNPYTAIEYARAAFDAGLVRPVWDVFEADEAGLRELALPGDAARLVLRRAARLGPEDQHILRIAAVVGAQFPVDLVARAAGVRPQHAHQVLGTAAHNGLVELLEDGRYAFRHDSIRAALTAEYPADELRRRHQRVAGLLAERGRRADAYALAAHFAAGEPGHDPGGQVRANRAAAERALAELEPQTAVGYLMTARAVADEYGVPLGAGFDRLLAVAYHRVGRFDEALAALDQALGRTTGRYRRAGLYRLKAEVQDSAGLGQAALDSAELGLAALGRPLPVNPVPRVLYVVAVLMAGLFLQVTRIGFGTALGRQRQRHQLQTALYYLGGSGAVRALKPAESLLFVLLNAYPANRLGRSAERVRSLASLSFPLRMAGLHTVADRVARSATRQAEELGDPAMLAYVAWLDARSSHASGLDDGGKLAAVLTGRAGVLDAGLALDAYAILICDHTLRGEVAAGEALAGRRARLQKTDGQGTCSHAGRSSIAAVDASLLALRGRAGEAASLLGRYADDSAPLHARVDLLIARLHGAYERDDLGAAFDELTGAFDALGVRGRDLLPVQAGYFVWVAYGRLERARRAAGDDRVAAIAAARRAVADLGRIARRPILAGHHRIAAAHLRHLRGDHAGALARIAAAANLLRDVDAPLLAYEQAVLEARCLTALDVPGEAGRRARAALMIAQESGWPHRARRVAVEFGLENAAGLPRLEHGAGAPGAGAPGTGSPGNGRNRRSTALEQVSLAASRILDPVKLTQIALDETIRLLGAERALLLLIDPATGLLEPYAGRDADGNDLPELAGFSATVVQRVREARAPLVVTGTEHAEALGSRSAVQYGLRSILGAPLQLDERLLGVVYLDSRVAKGVFTVDDVELLTTITHHIAVSLETARAAQLEVAVATANRQRDLAETLRAAMSRFSAILDPATVLRELLNTALSSPGGDHGWVLLGAAGDPTVKLLDGSTMPMRPSLAALLNVRAPRLGGGSWGRDLFAGEAASWLVVPLTSREGPAGVLVLASAAAGAWTDADLQVVAALALQGLVAYENALLFSRINHLAVTDSLTGVANRRRFFELASSALAEPGPISAFMIDIDHFKKINDEYGHQVGDDVIRGVVARLSAVAAALPGVLGRYGGEEFALLLPGLADGREIGEALRAAVAGKPVATRGGPVVVTISVGVTGRVGKDDTPDVLLGRADASLYAAKQGGRDRVVAHRA